MKRTLLTSLFSLIFLVAFSQHIPFQGKLTQNDEPFSGNVTLQFSITAVDWTETHENVTVLDGFYSVVLGSNNPLPDSLFSASKRIMMGIKVNGTALSPVAIYAPFTEKSVSNMSIDSVRTRDAQVVDGEGKLKAHLNYHAPNDAGSLVLYGANDSTKVILGSVAGGYGGFLGLYDSLRNIGAQLRVTSKGVGNLFSYDANHLNTGWFGNASNAGGFMQIVGYNPDGVFTGATLSGFASWDNGLPYFMMEGSSEDPYVQLLQFGGMNDGVSEKPYFHMNSSSRAISGIGSALTIGISQRDQGFIELKGGNDRNWDLRARLMVDSVHNLGTAGKLELFGPLGNENNDVRSHFSVMAVNDPNGSDPMGAGAEMFLHGTNSPNFQMGGKPWENNDHAFFQMYGSKGDGGGWYLPNIQLDVHSSMETYDAATINLFNTTEGASYHTIQIGSSGNNNSGFFNIRNSSMLDIISFGDRGGGSGEAKFYGPTGGLRLEQGAFGDDSGFLILYGPNGSKNIQIDRDPGNTNVGQINVFGTDGITPQVLVGVGTDSVNEWGHLHVAGPNGSVDINGEFGSIDAVSVNQTSDQRLKENIQLQENALEKVKQLRGVTFEWKKDNTDAQNVGFIAQEVEKVYPEVVNTKEDGFKSVNYAVLVSALVEAIKELDAKIADLQAENIELKASLQSNQNESIAKLQAEIEAIKNMLGASSPVSVQGASK